MDEPLEKLRTMLYGAWRHRWLALGVAWAVALPAVLLVPLVAQRYEATARIYVDTQSVLKPLMAGLAYQPDIDQQVDMLARTLISRPHLERVVDRPGLGFTATGPAAREQLLTRLAKAVRLTPAAPGNLYTISYRDVQPERARRLVAAMVDLFVTSSSGDKQRDSEQATRFINEQIRLYETKLTEAENRLKAFKIRNFGISGVSDQDYFARMSAISGELDRARADLRAAEQTRDAYRRELANESPQLPVQAEIDTALAAQRKKLNELLTRFTDQHPDVIGARQVLADLQAQQREQSQARARGARGSAGPAPTSPVFQRLRIALAESEAQVGSLRSRVAAEQRRLDAVRADAGRAPQVEAELAQLNRDYDILRKNYEQLVTRRESATLGERMDASSQLTDFRVVDPPRVAPSPVFPSHLELAALAVVTSLVLGVFATVLVRRLRPTIESARSLQQLTGRPVLATVSLSRGAAPSGRAALALFTLGLAALLALQLGWLAWVATRTLA